MLPVTTSHDAFVDRIRERLPVTPVPRVPELRMHLAGPRSGLRRLLADHPAAGPPYWAHVWGGGLVLARYLFDHPAIVAGHRVLDLGCGSGLVAVAAALCGAREVLAVDTDRYAVAAASANADLNRAEIMVRLADLLDGPAPPTDLVLVGDLFYEDALAQRVSGFLDRCVATKLSVLVGDPGRAPLPRNRLSEIYNLAVPDFGGGSNAAYSAVYRYTGTRA